jgi:hypothetical protein
LDEATASSFNLNHDKNYVITLDEKRWLACFRKWHGQHAMFYCPMRDSTIAIHYTDLRKLGLCRLKRLAVPGVTPVGVSR